jgi:hypothetical protein
MGRMRSAYNIVTRHQEDRMTRCPSWLTAAIPRKSLPGDESLIGRFPPLFVTKYIPAETRDSLHSSERNETLRQGVPYSARVQDVTVQLWQARVEACSNTSTVTLRVVGGDVKGSLKF